MSAPNVNETNQQPLWPLSRTTWVFLGFGVIAGFYLLTEHTAHVFGVLPYALLLACPLLHVFHYGRHGGHGGHSGERPTAGGDGSGPVAGGPR